MQFDRQGNSCIGTLTPWGKGTAIRPETKASGFQAGRAHVSLGEKDFNRIQKFRRGPILLAERKDKE